MHKLNLRNIPVTPDTPALSKMSFSAVGVAITTPLSDKKAFESLDGAPGGNEVLRKSSKCSQNMLLYCGLAAKNPVQKRFITSPLFTHNQHTNVDINKIKYLYTLLAHFNHRFLHTFFIQFTSVREWLFTESTGLTITTTYKLISNGELI